jgi:tetratricopeptide (TPR) repeat protein
MIYSLALMCFDRSLALKEELHDNTGKALELRNKGIVYFKKGDYQKALDQFKKSVQVSNELIVQKLIKDTYLKLSTVYSFSNDFVNADKHHALYRSLKDSIAAIENAKDFPADRLQNELSEKEKVIELLSKENEQQTLVLNQQGLELSQQLTVTELNAKAKRKRWKS